MRFTQHTNDVLSVYQRLSHSIPKCPLSLTIMVFSLPSMFQWCYQWSSHKIPMRSPQCNNDVAQHTIDVPMILQMIFPRYTLDVHSVHQWCSIGFPMMLPQLTNKVIPVYQWCYIPIMFPLYTNDALTSVHTRHYLPILVTRLYHNKDVLLDSNNVCCVHACKAVSTPSVWPGSMLTDLCTETLVNPCKLRYTREVDTTGCCCLQKTAFSFFESEKLLLFVWD